MNEDTSSRPVTREELDAALSAVVSAILQRFEERFEATVAKLEAAFLERLEATEARLEAIESRLEAIAARIEATEAKLEAAFLERLEATETKLLGAFFAYQEYSRAEMRKLKADLSSVNAAAEVRFDNIENRLTSLEKIVLSKRQ
jgi:cytochrome c556